jgi:hypothetical protein
MVRARMRVRVRVRVKARVWVKEGEEWLKKL